MKTRSLILWFAVLITAGNCGFVAWSDPDAIAIGSGDEHTEFAYLLATGKEALVFPELAADRNYLARAVAFDLATIRAGAFTPRSGGGVLLAYPVHALAMRSCRGYFAIKLWPILNYTIIYLAWAAFAAAYFPRFTVVVVSLLFLLPPFNLRSTCLFIIGSQTVSLLFTSLMVAALALLKRGWTAAGFGLAALLAGLGLAACPKNLVDVLALAAVIAVLLRRGAISRRVAVLAALLAVAGYLPLPVGYASAGIAPFANFTDHENLSTMASWRSWEGIAADARRLGDELRKAFVYQRDLSPSAFAGVDYLYAGLALAAMVGLAVTSARRISRLPPAEAAARSYLALAPIAFLAVYLPSSIRLYDLERIANFTAYRYYAALYPPAFIAIGWLLAAVRRRLTGRRLFLSGLLLALLVARPLAGTLRMLHPARGLPEICTLRPVHFVPLGWLLGKANPSLAPADAEARVLALAEREDDAFVMAREYFRFYLRARRLSTDELLDYRRQLRVAAVARGFAGALGADAVEERTPVPAAAGSLARGRVENRFEWGRLLAALPPAEQTEFWRGMGYADAAWPDGPARFDGPAGPAPRGAAAGWYYEGVGEAMMHTHYRYSLRSLQYDYHYTTANAEAMIAAFGPGDVGTALRTGLARARARFRLQPRPEPE